LAFLFGGIGIVEFRGQTNAFSIGSKTQVIVIPKEIEKELEMDENKKTFFKIFTEYKDGKKRIIYEFMEHALKKKE